MEQIQAGAHPEDVAKSLGMRRSTVFAWLAKFREGGMEALRAKPVPGRPPKLSGAQLRKLYAFDELFDSALEHCGVWVAPKVSR